MFYNTYRTTKSTMRSADKNNLAGYGRSIINQRETLLNLQKRQKLADFVFRQYPMSSAALVAWFKLKRYELVCIKIAVESARLNINSQETLNSMGISVVE